jgi:dienelactone hydrolase
MKTFARLIAAGGLLFTALAQSADFSTRDVQFYSEGVLCAAKLYLPAGASDAKKSAAVVIAPAAAETQGSVERQAAALASSGVVAMTFDYRGWGSSGGFLYFHEPVRSDDRLRFTPMTTRVDIRRKRIDPLAQTLDIRNAITFLQGDARVDRARIGLWGIGLSADHAMVVAGGDARLKAFVSQSPTLAGKDGAKQAFKPSAKQQATMVSLARTGSAPKSERAAVAMNEKESELALAEYFPVWSLDSVPATTAALFIGNVNNAKDNAALAAAAKRLKGPTEVSTTPEAVAPWFVKTL